MDRVSLGRVIRRHREARGWTLRDLGERAGLSHAFIGAIEVARPAANPTIRALGDIFDALGVTAEVRVHDPTEAAVIAVLDAAPERRLLLLAALTALASLPMDELDLEADMLARRAARAASSRQAADG